jgi:hypothetical protein
MKRLTLIARPSRVNSSITFNIFKVRPSAVVSNWKSIAQMTFGRIGDIAPTATPTPVKRFFFAALRHPQALVTPQTADALVVDLPAGSAGHLGCPSPPPARPVGGEPAQPDTQLGFLSGDRHRRQAHRGTVDVYDPAGSAFGHPEPVAHHLDGAALAVRGQKFPAEISLSMSMSRAWFATSFFRTARTQ